jgi:hypothetical protein
VRLKHVALFVGTVTVGVSPAVGALLAARALDSMTTPVVVTTSTVPQRCGMFDNCSVDTTRVELRP